MARGTTSTMSSYRPTSRSENVFRRLARPDSALWRVRRDRVALSTISRRIRRPPLALRAGVASLVALAVVIGAVLIARRIGWPHALRGAGRFVDDRVGVTSPFAPRVHLPGIGRVPRWSVVVFVAAVGTAFALAADLARLPAFVAIVLVGTLWAFPHGAAFGLILVAAMLWWFASRRRSR